jgi:stalled ribosome rescue protein Dom34
MSFILCIHVCMQECRSTDIKERGRCGALVDEVAQNGGKVHVFPEHSEPAQRMTLWSLCSSLCVCICVEIGLSKLGGMAAVLMYPLYEEDYQQQSACQDGDDLGD